MRYKNEEHSLRIVSTPKDHPFEDGTTRRSVILILMGKQMATNITESCSELQREQSKSFVEIFIN